jgi:thymidine phosphorylase
VRWVAALGGDAAVVGDPWSVMRRAPVELDVPAPSSGTVSRLDALEVGLAAVRLGAGRARKEDAVDHAVGIVLHAKPGAAVDEGQPLARIHAADDATARAAAADVLAASTVTAEAFAPPPILIGAIR